MFGRRWWLGLAALIAIALPFGSLWLDWVTAVVNADGSVLRNLNSYPFLALPLIVRAASTRELIRVPRLRWPQTAHEAEATSASNGDGRLPP